jgi:hypothetical protein
MEGACDRHATRNSGLGHAASIAPGSGAAVVVDFSSVRGAFSPHLTRFPGSTCGACASVCVCTFYKVGYTTLAVNVCVCAHFLESPLYSCSTTSLVDLLYSKCTRAMTFQNVFLSGVLEPRAVVGWYCVGAEGRVGPHLLGTLLARHNMLKSPLNLATLRSKHTQQTYVVNIRSKHTRALNFANVLGSPHGIRVASVGGLRMVSVCAGRVCVCVCARACLCIQIHAFL